MHPHARDGLTVTVLVCLLLMVPASAGSVAAQEGGYVVEQGDRCVTMTPLEGDETVEEFYSYTNDTRSSAGTVALQRADTSIVFLYEGPEGLSLVMVHGRLDGTGDSGSASFTVSGLSPSATWAVEDDNYTVAVGDRTVPAAYDQWQHSSGRSVVDWTWYRNRTDGGAIRDVESSLPVSVEPRFNESAALYGQYYYGNVTDWQVLSGDRDEPARVSLDLTEPITVRQGQCEGTPIVWRTQSTTDPAETSEDEDQP